ncbi:phospholipid phosphatase 5-like [Lineus longissimus]|uniref:phospholipid phosphatase 5-like n=1 Tax=Lineus longissimus TaxID=88925 RepID=UPI002B4EC837
MKAVSSYRANLAVEIAIRLMLGVVFVMTEFMEPFHRVIQPEELWLYKNPVTVSYVSTLVLWFSAATLPTVIIIVFAIGKRDLFDATRAFLALTLAYGLNGVITNSVKLAVGRPRPDFFYRCFPDGNYRPDMKCSGDAQSVRDGRKSFPSGHASWSFTMLTFISLYLAGKLKAFTNHGRGQSLRLVAVIAPVFTATLIAVSRTADYHHHWQDVTVGSILGITLAFLSYRHYYPAVTDDDCDKPSPLMLSDQSALEYDNGKTKEYAMRIV